jgi:hypothetical protein
MRHYVVSVHSAKVLGSAAAALRAGERVRYAPVRLFWVAVQETSATRRSSEIKTDVLRGYKATGAFGCKSYSGATRQANAQLHLSTQAAISETSSALGSAGHVAARQPLVAVELAPIKAAETKAATR